MCGIAGFIKRCSSGSSQETLKGMASVLAHRGPDAEGFFHAKSEIKNYEVGLAHRRLAIIDLVGGQQPLSNEDGTIQIVFNGEIYNFQDLRRSLIDLGHVFRTKSDTESIIHAYEEYDERCVNHLRGMFAFAIWDGRKEKLILARDHFGKKPLFVHKSNKGLFFASEIKSLLTIPSFQATIDTEAIYHYLTYRYIPGPRTLFKGISKIPPGSIAVCRGRKITQKTYYCPPDKYQYIQSSVSKDPVNEFLEKLDESVAIRMVSDVPFGAFLSGGIDSSAVVGLMSRHSLIPVKTFSVGFKERQYSELSYAATIAKRFGTEHHELVVSADQLMDELEDLIGYRDAPVAEPADIPIYLLSKEARRKVKMVLTGEGSDEILGGYPKHVFERYTHLYQFIPSSIRGNLIEPLIRSLPYKFRRAKTAIINLGLTEANDRLPRWFGAISSSERDLFCNISSCESLDVNEVQFSSEANNSLLRKILYFDQTSWLPDNLLERGDRMTMAASLEARMPFMDYKLAEYVSSLPDNFRVRGMQTKWILRQAMKRLLPEHILKRPKVGFRVPVNEWFMGPMRDYLYDHLTGPSSVTIDYYNKPMLENILIEHTQAKQNHEKLLWSLLTLELWHRRNKIST